MFKLVLEKAEEPDVKLPTSVGSLKKQENSRKKKKKTPQPIYFCFIDYTKDFDCVDHNKLWKILQKIGVPDHLTCLKRDLYVDHEARVRIDMEKWTGFKSLKEYIKAAYCHPAYLTFMQNTS